VQIGLPSGYTGFSQLLSTHVHSRCPYNYRKGCKALGYAFEIREYENGLIFWTQKRRPSLIEVQRIGSCELDVSPVSRDGSCGLGDKSPRLSRILEQEGTQARMPIGSPFDEMATESKWSHVTNDNSPVVVMSHNALYSKIVFGELVLVWPYMQRPDLVWRMQMGLESVFAILRIDCILSEQFGGR